MTKGGLFLLLILNGQQQREAVWETKHVDFSEGIRFDLTVAGLMLTLTLLVLSGGIPSISIQAITDQIRSFTNQANTAHNPIPDSLGLQQPPVGDSAFEALRSPGLPQEHLIGSGPELSKRVVMTVASDVPGLRYYWRSVTYNQYTGHGWVTTPTEFTAYKANVRLINTALPGQQLVHLDINPVESLGGIVYDAGSLVTVSSDFNVAYRTNQDLFSATTQGSYAVESLVANPSAAQLRATPATIPDFIRFRYLVLPDNIPARVLNLARDLTATAPTPYDRAKAIETYLRNYTYTLDLPAPPPNKDIVDYFLFDLKRGYCDYYASSMVVLARAAGIPARLVSGYASGTYDAQTKRYIVTEADAHSWAEIYFEGYGWVEFEPTGGRPSLDRSVGSQPTAPVSAVLPPQAAPEPSASPSWFFIGWLVLVVVTVGVSGWQLVDWLRLRTLSPAQTQALLYQRLTHNAKRLAVRQTAGDTPYEFARALGAALAQRQMSPAHLQQIKRLIDLYVQTIYSPRAIGRAEQQEAIGLWNAIRWPLWWAGWRLTARTAQPAAKRV